MTLETDPFTPTALDSRITVDEARETVEIDLPGLYFHTSRDVNRLYDRIEERLLATGESQWFFAVNTAGYRIDETAWFAFDRRGQEVREAYAMATVRYEDTDETRARIVRDAGTEREVPNLFGSRDDALAHLARLPSQRVQRIERLPSHDRDGFVRRLSFDPDARIFEIDLSGVSFEHSRDVNDIYDWLEEALRGAGGKWFFLINYDGTRIQSPAWVQFAARGKALNEAFSLGSVRYAPGSETETDIRLRAESQGFRPNIRNTRAEAVERIEEMRAGIEEDASA